MREIKFRAWDEETKEMEYSKRTADLGFWKWVSYSSYTIVEQFTGLHDKNGKEIYEGDILEFVLDGKKYNTNPVRWKNEYGFYIAGITVGEWEPEDILYAEYEISGNIHENPELLEE